MKIIAYLYVILIWISIGCNQNQKKYVQLNEYPNIYPDYKDICIPYNIAPINFMLKCDCDEMEVELSGKKSNLKVNGSYKIYFPIKEFKTFLSENKGDTIWVTVSRLTIAGWQKYKAFYWKIETEDIDNYLTYRLIEPGYEVWNKISIAQRNVTNFDESYIADNNLCDGSCINCHIGCKQNPEKSFFHIRGANGMTVIANGKKLRKLNTKPEGAYSNMIYGNWHPSGRFIAFSNNIVLPCMHSFRDKRAFVYDTVSDIVVFDIEKNEILTSPLLSKAEMLETFPEFSADGKKLYFCSAKKVNLPEDNENLKYSLYSIDYDPITRTFGQRVDTLYNGPKNGKTVSEPKSSPDGKFILFTSFSYGTFPIWHIDARLYSYNLSTHLIDTLPALNNNEKYSNSYHSWSKNSRWVVFASKRDNGLYGKPFFSYIDSNGNAHKPFVLPQEDAEFYDFTYKSYNIPELFEKARQFDALDIEKLFKNKSENEKVKYLK
jgi:hypothetical protein